MDSESLVSGLPSLISPNDLARALGIPRSTTRYAPWQKRVGLHPLKIGRPLMFDLKDVQDMLARMRAESLQGRD